MNSTNPRWKAVVLVAATYFYFLIYAQFAFLHLVETGLGREAWNGVLGSMAACGVLGAGLTAKFFRNHHARRWLLSALVGCGLSGAIALMAATPATYWLAAAGTGLSLAILTVSVVGTLDAHFPPKHLGLLCGLGTGSAYFLSNVPWLFTATPQQQTLAAIVGVMLGGFGLPSPCSAPISSPGSRKPITSSDRRVLAGFVIIFLCLVWTDSAAFTQIQSVPRFLAASWTGDASLWMLGGVHLISAVIAGVMMDRRLSVLLFGTAFLLLLAGWLTITRLDGGLPATLGYVAGVSLYSTALVAFAPLQKGSIPVVFQAGLVYAVAGWIGSALGIGMASDLGGIPAWFWMASGVALAVGIAMTLAGNAGRERNQ